MTADRYGEAMMWVCRAGTKTGTVWVMMSPPPPSDSEVLSPAEQGPNAWTGWRLDTASGRTRVEQIVEGFAQGIEAQRFAPGARLPSIREAARGFQVSRFTVVEAYERLIARGLIESRPGSGFYVRERSVAAGLASARVWAETPNPKMDVVWLLRNLFRQLPLQDMPGGGVLPADWLEEGLIATSLRSVARTAAPALLAYGQPQGYLPLRQQLQRSLAAHEIEARPEQIVLVNGVTQGLDLVAQHCARPGDTLLVDDPGWFLMYGRFSQLGLKVVGVPRLADGPDIEALRALCVAHRPRLYVLTATHHNPTGTSMSAAKAYQVLRLAEAHDFLVVDDDIYGDLQAGAGPQPSIRLAALDRFERTIHLGGFSKVLGPNLRVGFVACAPALAAALTDLKMLVGLTSCELAERVVTRVLADGHYRRHLERLRGRLAQSRPALHRRLERIGLKPFTSASAGLFVWADTGVDTRPIAEAMLAQGYVTAPGSLFSPDQRPSTWMRFNVATSGEARMWSLLESLILKSRRAPQGT